MQSFLTRYATPLTTGLFLVSLISGIALFFHLGSRFFHGMHEWLSMVLIVPFVLHVWKNWRAFLTYFKRPPMAIALALSVIASAVFVVPQLSASNQAAGVNPRAVFGMMQGAKIADLAPLAGLDGAALVSALEAKGFSGVTPEMTLSEAATASGKSATDGLSVLLASRKP